MELSPPQARYVLNHVFMPIKLPQENDLDLEMELALCTLIHGSAGRYRSSLPRSARSPWSRVVKMLKEFSHMQECDLSKVRLQKSLSKLHAGDSFALLIRAQNAGLIIRKTVPSVTFESFEVSPPAQAVMETTGKLRCSYPGPAISIPVSVFEDRPFLQELCSFLAQMNVDHLDNAVAITKKAGSEVVEERDTAHPRHITELLTGILRGMGRVARVARISKCISDDVLWKDARGPWRRSSTWLVIRVALQTTLYKPHRDGHAGYKSFMLFFLSELLQEFLNVPEISSEDLHLARAKLSRRFYKLRTSAPTHVSHLANKVVDDVEVVLKQRWLKVQQSQTFSPPWEPETLDPEADTRLQLKISDRYLSQLTKNTPTPTPCEEFSPSHPHRTLFFGSHEKLIFGHPSISDTFVALADFEESVKEGIDAWILVPRSSEELRGACELLEYYIISYSSTALTTYAKNPENESLMLLTIFELWVALDKLSISAIPLLLDYLPEIPWQKLDSLLLRERTSMDRLTHIQEYIHRRERDSSSGSVFADGAGRNAFSVRYYSYSSEMQLLRNQIEDDAERERQRKRIELESVNAEHAELLKRIDTMNHEYSPSGWRGHYIHDDQCQRCSEERSANSMTIAVHEWPLPSNDNDAEFVIFESRCPPVFAIWRSVTYQILCDICSPIKPQSKVIPPISLHSYSGLSRYVKGTTRRISIASSTKSFLRSHYDRTKVPAAESKILVNNALQYHLFDSNAGAWAAGPFGDFDISAYCTLLLPHGSYEKMQYAVSGTSHTSNDVLAQQYNCPKELNLHEFISFGSLRAGYRLQWMNIAREIRTKTFSFQQPEVNVLLMQAALQVGPSNGKWREHHLELLDADFGGLLLDELKLLLQTVETNWQEVSTVRTIVGLTSRVVEFAIERSEVVKKGCILLKNARMVTEEWMEALQQRLRATESEDEASNLRLRLCETAATCQSTYNVPAPLLTYLIVTPEDVASYVRVAIIINDNTPPISSLSNHVRRLLDQNRRLAHRIEASLQQSTSRTNEGMHLALESIWNGYSRGSAWTKVCEPNERWYTTCTSPGANTTSQTVHFDVQDGGLLVDGKPLGRLPSAAMQHPLYQRTFGKLILDVVPAAIPGLQFAACRNFRGYQVYFSHQRSSNRLVIRARKGDCIHELVPHRELMNDFPILLIENYAHWLNIDDGSMEFRPLTNQWESSPTTNWILQHQPEGRSIMSIGNDTKLVDVYSRTFSMLSSRLQPLEHPENMVITFSPTQVQPVEVRLPRFRLSFTLNSRGFLESNDIVGTVLDEIRHSGTLIGLQNQIVLRPVDSLFSSRVLIPQGQVEFGQNQDQHVFITVNTRFQSHVHYHEYKIDTHLGRLVGDATLLSHLYLTYFHALSSHCLPDPLLGCTGTEQALSLLYAAKSRSFQKLGRAEAEMLQAIGHLTPHREWYPRHLQNMQMVEWLNLPALSQHQAFEPEVQNILNYGAALSSFYPDDIRPVYDRTPSAHLMERARHRTSAFSSQAILYYLDNNGNTSSDIIYRSRDLRASRSDPEDRACCISSLTYRWPSKLPTETDLYAILCEWSSISGPGTVHSLSYSQSWLTDRFIPSHWMSLCDMLRRGSKDHIQPLLVFSLSAAAFSGFYSRTLLYTMLAFAISPDIRWLIPPPWPEYHLHEGHVPNSFSVLQAVRESILPFESAPESHIFPVNGETPEQYQNRSWGLFTARVEIEEQQLVHHFMAQWPAQAVDFPQTLFGSAFDLSLAIAGVSNLFYEWFKNMQLWDHVSRIQRCLDRERGAVSLVAITPEHRFSACLDESMSLAPAVTLSRLLHGRKAPHVEPSSSSTSKIRLTHAESARPQLETLNTLFGEFRGSKSQLRQHYGEELESSRIELKKQRPRLQADPTSIAAATLEEYERECRSHLDSVLASVQAALRPENLAETMLLTAGLWPRCTVRQLLGSLSSRSGVECSLPWKRALTALCLALMWYQRSRRLLKFASSGNHDELLKELENGGYDSEDMQSLENIEWLLIQVDNDFLMRRIQASVAKEMIYPSSGHNTATQLNMGEGKTAVIVPVVSTTLADGDRLVRVVVLKPLAAQMFQLLVERVSGLVNQQVFYLPFSRGFEMTKISVVQSLLSKCAAHAGVLVIQPEHILSLKLTAVHRILDSASVAQTRGVLELQRWLEQKSRDVLDESDEILHVRYQMVYTVGLQRALEDQPDRWTTTQQVLGLVKKHVPTIFAQCPDGVEVTVNSLSATFPQIRFTRKDACDALVSLVVDDVLAGHLDNLSFDRLSPEGRQAARAMLTEQHPGNHSFLEDPTFRSDSLFKGLLLLRGLLYQGVLVYALSQRRWRVDYGLHLDRTPLAVPYRAKDVPSLRAEFGHPDVAIVLTCLSYYYGGLGDHEVDLCFTLLLQLDNPEVEYEQWIRGADIPQELRNLSGVNLQDPAQVQKILRPIFRLNHVVIDFYLSHVVFPKAAKEFPHKLSTSAWDLAESTCHPTTGFSGTNDNHPLLPLSIAQTDPLKQLSTNAQVLSYLLQPENNFYRCMESSTSKVASCIDMIVSEEKEIRVLLDVGAQMLDMKNQELASHWLRSRSQGDVDAVVFFGDDDEKYVITHDGTVSPLVSSPFRRQLDRCLLYLDDSHTRGSDFKLPRTWRAAVTLGPGVSKDRLTQGCMRMRQLGLGQSVLFLAPLEVDRSIRKIVKKTDSDDITAYDVLHWSMEETCRDIEHHLPRWAHQGLDYKARSDEWEQMTTSPSDSFRAVWQQPEARSLQDMYGFDSDPSGAALRDLEQEYPELHERCSRYGVSSFSNSEMDEEQEREVSHEIERERQVERPPKAKAAQHSVDNEIRTLVNGGSISKFSSAFESVLLPWSDRLDSCWGNYPTVLATKDFLQVTEEAKKGLTEYSRPVAWIISFTARDTTSLVLLSPYEVNELLPAIRKGRNGVHLHVYSPRVTEATGTFEDLDFYCIPRLPWSWRPPAVGEIVQLNLWAGQLYLQDYEYYMEVCRFLGLYFDTLYESSDTPLGLDGFVRREHRTDDTQSWFIESPMPLLKELFGLRRKGQSFLKTPMGKILHGKTLKRDDF